MIFIIASEYDYFACSVFPYHATLIDMMKKDLLGRRIATLIFVAVTPWPRTLRVCLIAFANGLLTGSR